MKLKSIILSLSLFFAWALTGVGQITEPERTAESDTLLYQVNSESHIIIMKRELPAEWDKLIFGGRFMDLFLPIPVMGPLTSDTWGADAVVPRYTQNGIEDKEWSYWGGNAVRDEDGSFHLFVCRWPENSEKGHMEWPNSEVVHTVSKNSLGPYKVLKTIGKGHNPEIFQLKDGRYVIYVIDGHYVAEDLNGPWEYGKFEFDPRDRNIIEGLSNLSFVIRKDGSYLMVCRGGGIWVSEDGISPYRQITNKRVYPAVEGHFEDPVIWKDNVQYNMIVNDFTGRIAYYLRSKDGVNWKVDPGEAYRPGITVYEDGTREEWFKYERIKVLQDEYGRPTQAHFAVIDTIKWEDYGNDKHSSKHICIPLTKGRLIEVLNKKPIDGKTKIIKVKILAGEDFDPNTDINFESVRFGASEVINYGGGSKLIGTEKDGDDLILVFKGDGNGFTKENFAGKLLGRTRDGMLLFGYSRLPGVVYNGPILSALEPRIENEKMEFEVQNFGLETSGKKDIKIILKYVNEEAVYSATVPSLKPYEKTRMVVNIPPVDRNLKPAKIGIYTSDKNTMALFEKMYERD